MSRVERLARWGRRGVRVGVKRLARWKVWRRVRVSGAAGEARKRRRVERGGEEESDKETE